MVIEKFSLKYDGKKGNLQLLILPNKAHRQTIKLKIQSLVQDDPENLCKAILGKS